MQPSRWTALTLATFIFLGTAPGQTRPRFIQRKQTARRSSAPRRPGAALNLLSYYGGPVMSNVQVLAVFWTSAVDMGEQNNAPGFYGAVTNSPWIDLLSQYSTVGLTGLTGHAGSNQSIGRGSFAGSYTITPANTNTTLSDADIQTELAHQISIAALPTPSLDSGGNVNTLYVVYFPLSITLSDPSIGTSCVEFCAYHNTLTLNSELVPYGVIPDQTPNSDCSLGCGADPSYINNLDSVCSHELAESITDTAVGIATAFDYPLAWYDPNPNDPMGGGEIGDLCNGEQGTTTGGGQTYTIQLLWSNRDGGCVASTSASTATATTLNSSSLPQAKFRQLRLTATVMASSVPVTQGSVAFIDNGVPFATVAVDSNGQAVYAGGLSVGRHNIVASFLGSGSFAASSSSAKTQYQSPKPR